MGLISDDLDAIQARLNDSGDIWPREELLRWYQDGYRKLLADSGAVRRFVPLELPPRVNYSGTSHWESSHTTGTHRKFTITTKSKREVTYQWEIEQEEGVTPTNSKVAFTQDWERAYGDESDRHYRIYFPREHDRLKRLTWDDRKMLPVSVRELDHAIRGWMRETGFPGHWTVGVGKSNTYEVFAIRTAYNQAYIMGDDLDAGIPRRFSGSRTYSSSLTPEHPGNGYAYTSLADSDHLTQLGDKPLVLDGMGWRFTQEASVNSSDSTKNDFHGTQVWEKEIQEGKTTFTTGATVGTYKWEEDFGAQNIGFPTGVIKGMSSPDRQYLPIIGDSSPFLFVGAARQWGSSQDALMALEVVVPEFPNLMEGDRPELIPSQMQKYLKFYVLSVAWGRDGEGHQKGLSIHYKTRFDRGVAFFRKLGDVTFRDREYQREMEKEIDRRPPRPRLGRDEDRTWINYPRFP